MLLPLESCDKLFGFQLKKKATYKYFILKKMINTGGYMLTHFTVNPVVEVFAQTSEPKCVEKYTCSTV